MKLFKLMKDGGDESLVWAYTLIEWKSVFSIMLLRFENGSREAYHSHAFNCFSWVLRGLLLEQFWYQWTHRRPCREHKASWLPFITRRTDLHKVTSVGRTWVLTFRGPWVDTWEEVVDGEVRTLTHNRRVICPNCKSELDPDVCHCGEEMKGHGWRNNHSPVPMGCNCYRSDQ